MYVVNSGEKLRPSAQIRADRAASCDRRRVAAPQPLGNEPRGGTPSLRTKKDSRTLCDRKDGPPGRSHRIEGRPPASHRELDAAA